MTDFRLKSNPQNRNFQKFKVLYWIVIQVIEKVINDQFVSNRFRATEYLHLSIWMMVLVEMFQTSSIFTSKQKNRKVLSQYSIGTNEKQGNYFKISLDPIQMTLKTLTTPSSVNDR